MASALIHISVAHEINKKLKRDSNKLLIGTIAPDIAKLINEPRTKSHFSEIDNDCIPILEKFLSKYKKNLNDDFVLGYYIHLYTDYLWFKYFLTELKHKNSIKKLDGTFLEDDNQGIFCKLIYNDYTNLNIKLIDEYELDLKIFYNDPPEIEHIITEIPMDKLNIVIDQMATIIKNSVEKKDLIFNLDNVKQFISLSVDLIISSLEELNIT